MSVDSLLTWLLSESVSYYLPNDINPKIRSVPHLALHVLGKSQLSAYPLASVDENQGQLIKLRHGTFSCSLWLRSDEPCRIAS